MESKRSNGRKISKETAKIIERRLPNIISSWNIAEDRRRKKDVRCVETQDNNKEWEP